MMESIFMKYIVSSVFIVLMVSFSSIATTINTSQHFKVGEKWPIKNEVKSVGKSIHNNKSIPLRECKNKSEYNAPIFKFEEGNFIDAMATEKLCAAIWKLNALVQKEWPSLRLRITEAYDQDFEHRVASIHYDGRAADMTTSDKDKKKLGRLAFLATVAGFDWVYYENDHVHASVKND